MDKTIKPYNIREYDSPEILKSNSGDDLNKDEIGEFKKYLVGIWENYKENKLFLYDKHIEDDEMYDSEDDLAEKNNNSYQPFFTFDGSKIRAKNYIGVVQCNGIRINIYPKIFDKSLLEVFNSDIETDQIKLTKRYIYDHILFWFSKCERFKFPFSKSDPDHQDFDNVLDIMIYIYCMKTLEAINSCSYYQYSEITEESEFLRGKLEINEYLKNISRGKEHKLVVTYNPFTYNNLLNKIIKYTTKLLSQYSTNSFVNKKLNEILFLLDEVDDDNVVSADCDKVKLNSFQDDYDVVLSLSKMFLSSQMVSVYNTSTDNICFLIPMEYVFEDFIATILKEHCSEYKVITQDRSRKLAFQDKMKSKDGKNEPDTFSIRPDIFLKHKIHEEKDIILDTKYKIRESKQSKEISQADVYQMFAYSLIHGCDNICLLYPSNNGSINNNKAEFWIRKDKETNGKIDLINLKAYNLPITVDFKIHNDKQQDLTVIIKDNLKNAFDKIFEDFESEKQQESEVL